MRRQLTVLALCGLLSLAGCTEIGVDGPGEPAPDDDVDGTLEVHNLNVGQADAILLVSPAGETMLIDSGDWRDDGETVIDYLDARGVDRIDHLVSTHGHADHIGGHAAVIDHYETEKEGVGAVYDGGVPHTTNTYERYLDAIERHDVTLYEVAEGDRIPVEGVEATVHNPERPGGDDLHYNSVALRVRFGETAFLFTGDAERDAERRMVEAHGEGLAADVYQAGHHGSDTSSSSALLDAVDPELAVVSSAYDSRYGHPHEEPLRRFAERDVAVTWTAVHGTVVLVSDGSEIAVRTHHDAPTDPLSIREAEAATAAPTDPIDSTGARFVVDGTDPGADAPSSASETVPVIAPVARATAGG